MLALLGVLLGSAVLDVVTGAALFGWGARGAFLALCFVGFRAFSIREYALLTIAVVATLVTWQSRKDPEIILIALDLAAFFGAFIVALTVMREVAARSRSILAVGRYIVMQPAGRRFWSVALGTHFLAVFLNFGAISLMAPMIQNSTIDANGQKDTALERRQLSSMIRGFSWVLLWAPTTLSQAVLLTIFTEATWVDIGPLGIVSAIGFILIGRVYDRWEWRHYPRVITGYQPPVPWRELATICVICSVLIGATLLGRFATGLSIAQILMILAPVVTVAWFLAQEATATAPSARRRLPTFIGLLIPSARGLARSAVALGASGYIGSALGQSLPMGALSDVLDLAAMPGWLFLAMLPVLISLGGQVALSPILLVVLLGEVLSGIPVLPTGQPQIIFALSLGWALSMTSAPNATATLLIASSCHIPPTTLTWVWNLRYGIICYLVSVGIFVLIA